jgi:hypothetical protein
MQDDTKSSTQSSNESTVVAPKLAFRDFLREKAEEFGIKDRHRRRREWVDAIQRLLDEIRGWLRLSDPDGFLDVEQYRVTRTERDLGTYDAHALKIRLGPIEVDVIPMSREVTSWVIKGAAGTRADFAGRIDMMDGRRKYNILREIRDGEEKWLIRDERNQLLTLTEKRSCGCCRISSHDRLARGRPTVV